MSVRDAAIEPPEGMATGDAGRPRTRRRRSIRAWCREAAGGLLRFSGVPWMIRQVCRRRATILVYHDPAPEILDKHLAYLAPRYHFIPLSRLVRAIREQDWTDMPPKPLVVTLDDGHRGNYRLLETIRRWNVRPTIFLCSEIINTRRRFWWKAGYDNSRELKQQPLDVMLDVLRREVGFEPEKEYDDRQSLSLDELREMAADVEFGSHTRFHPILVNCSDETCREEVSRSKERLEELLGCPVAHFSYTNGDYGERERQFVAETEYESARTLDIGGNDLESDPLRLRAMPVDDDASLNVLCGQACGIFGRIHAWFRHGRANDLRVLMLGTEPRGGGGMGTVVQHMLDYDGFARAGVKLRFLPIDHGLSVPRKLLYFARAVCGLALCGLRRQADLIHVHTCSGRYFLRAAVCVLIARAFRLPVLLHIHGGGFPRYLRRFRRAKLSVLNRCAAILVVNDHLREMFGDHPCSARVRVLYNMLPDRAGRGRLPKDNDGKTPLVRILYLGRFDPLKGCLELLEAFRTIRSTRSDARLIMAGEGRQWQAARRFIEENHLQDAVELHGWVDGEAKERLLDAADVMVLPSSVEAFPMVILEAMQRAMPVVTVNRPGVETQVVDRETGIIAPTPAPEHLAAALSTLIEDARLRRQYGEAGRRRFLERFTSKVIGPELVEIYRTCGAGHAAVGASRSDDAPGRRTSCARTHWGIDMRRFLMNRVVIPALDAVSGTQLAGYLRSLEESQWYSAEELRALQDEKLRAVIAHAYETVPFYRELMDQRKLTPQDIRTTDDLPKLPVVNKRMMKDITPQKTVSSSYDVRRLVPRKTSGSTGEPFPFYVSKQEKILKRAALARFWRWGGWDFGVRYVHMFSNPSSMFRRDGFLRSAEGFLMGRKFLCVKSLVPEHLDEIAAFGPKVLFGYASGVACLANFALDRGFKLDLKGILTTSDNLTPHYRNRIEKAFSVKVLDEYGGEDMSFMAQCEHADLYHGNAETTFMELLKDGQRVPAGESGEVVVTDLTRRAMPFIRYAMEDLAVGSTRRCPCGRGLPTYERIEGRNLDVLVTRSGRKIPATIVNYAMELCELKLYQVVQTQPDVLVVRIVPDKGFNSQIMDKMRQNLKEWVGPEFQFQVEVVDDIQRTAAGKCRVVSVEMENGCS